jgi:Kef-type K+ transport system membrane component KefB
MPPLDGLLVIVAVAFAAPFLLGLAPALRVPAVVVEIVGGIVVGPSVLGWVEIDATIEVLATVGLAFLLFLGGLEVDIERLRGAVFRLAAKGLAVSLALALVVGYALHATGVVETPLLIAVALGATSLGVLIPVLKDTGRIASPLGQLVIAGASLADFTAILLLSLLFAGEGGPGATLLLIGALLGLAVTVFAVVRGVQRFPRVRADLVRLQDTTAQIRVRGAFVLLVGFAAAAQALGLEVILGAFAAGAILSLTDPDRAMTHPDFRRKLEAVGFGVFIPIFFVSSGVRFDLGALAGSAAALPLFLLALLAVRGLPAALYARLVGRREALAAGLLQATSLPFLVTAAAIGRELGLIGAGEGAALVGAGLLSVLLFPAAGLALLRRPTHPKKGPAMPSTHCSAHATLDEADAAVRQLLADGVPGSRISVVSGNPSPDHAHERMGGFAGDAGQAGAYAGMPGDIMGSFSPAARAARHGSFGDTDRDEVATFDRGVRRTHVGSHREIERRLAEAGVEPREIAAVHEGHVVVLVSAG